MATHTQVTLRRGTTHQVSWIPSEFAEVNRVVDLREREADKGEKIWDRGWTVISVGTVAMDSKRVEERGQDYKKTRGASDI